MRVVADDGETVIRDRRWGGMDWRTLTDPAETRWFHGEWTVLRSYHGWKVVHERRFVAECGSWREAMRFVIDRKVAS